MRPLGPPPPNPDDYPIVEIPMGLLWYRWIDTERWGTDKAKQWMEHYARWEICLKDPTWEPADYKEQILLNTYISICKEARDDPKRSGLIHPLNVGKYGGRYPVFRGNMRFCILRVRGYVGKVSCRVALPEDIAGDMTQSYVAFPYDKDVNYDAIRKQFES